MDARETLRRSYRPAETRVLFVGESPPAAGTFFYAADSGLYRVTRNAFQAGLPDCWGPEFLRCFAELGCYLVDLCDEPVNRLTDRADGSFRRRLRARRDGESQLAEALAGLRPQVIIVLLKGIAANVARAAALAGCADAERHVLTYPGRWHWQRLAYERELTRLLRDLSRRGVLLVPPEA